MEKEVIVGVGCRDVDRDGEVSVLVARVDESRGGESIGKGGGCQDRWQTGSVWDLKGLWSRESRFEIRDSQSGPTHWSGTEKTKAGGRRAKDGPAPCWQRHPSKGTELGKREKRPWAEKRRWTRRREEKRREGERRGEERRDAKGFSLRAKECVVGQAWQVGAAETIGNSFVHPSGVWTPWLRTNRQGV